MDKAEFEVQMGVVKMNDEEACIVDNCHPVEVHLIGIDTKTGKKYSLDIIIYNHGTSGADWGATKLSKNAEITLKALREGKSFIVHGKEAHGKVTCYLTTTLVSKGLQDRGIEVKV